MGLMLRRLLVPVLAKLGSRTIIAVGGTLFVLNMLIPDPLPLVDELLILALTILFSRWATADAAAVTGTSAAPGEPKPVGRGSTQR